MFDCIILLYIIYQHQSDPEISDITWNHTKSKFMVPKIREYYQFDTVKFEFSFVCEYLSFWDVYFRFRIGDGAWENRFWWLILVMVSKSNVPRHYGILSANVFTWDSLFIQSFFSIEDCLWPSQDCRTTPVPNRDRIDPKCRTICSQNME